MSIVLSQEALLLARVGSRSLDTRVVRLPCQRDLETKKAETGENQIETLDQPNELAEKLFPQINREVPLGIMEQHQPIFLEEQELRAAETVLRGKKWGGLWRHNRLRRETSPTMRQRCVCPLSRIGCVFRWLSAQATRGRAYGRVSTPLPEGMESCHPLSPTRTSSNA